MSRIPAILRRPAALVAAGVALLVALAIVLTLSLTSQAPARPAAGGAPQPAPSGSATPAPTPAPTAEPTGDAAAPAPELTEDEAEESVVEFFTASDAAAAKPEDGIEGLEKIASGAILSEIEAEYTELAAYGWTRHGNATLSDVTVLESDEKGARVQACVDVSDVVIEDAAGKPIPSAADVGTARSLTIFSLEYDGAEWRLTERSFPTDPSC
jgi:hypothetical protein